MRDISKEISKYTRKFSINCPLFGGETSQCRRPGGCACEKNGEIYGLIHSLIKPQYRQATIFSFDGKLRGADGKKIESAEPAVDPAIATRVRGQLCDYLYKDRKEVISARKTDGSIDRAKLNANSQLDKRFVEGSNVIIYSNTYSCHEEGSKKNHFLKIRSLPTGKTLLASIIMIDAIHRKAFSTNRASSYEWVSFLQLRTRLKNREDSTDLNDIQDADWLVIDDMNLIVPNETSRSDLWTREVFDSFLIERIENKKPTIMVCEFDIEKEPLLEKMGAAFEKIARSPQTCLINLSSKQP